MRFRTAFYLFAAIAILACLPFSLAAQESFSQNDELAWRTQHATDLQKPDGWLSLIGLEWLQPGDTALGSAPESKIHLPAYAPPHLAVLKLENGAVQFLAPQ